MNQYLFFDLDNTLTPSRSSIAPELRALLKRLNKTITVVSGSMNEQMRAQIGDLSCYQLGQNGNHALNPEGDELWKDFLTDEEKDEIYTYIDTLRQSFTHTVPDESDLVQDRGAQIAFSIYGHHAPTEEKRVFDGNFKKRKALLEQFPFSSTTIDVQMGGNTNLDFFRKGRNKGSNIIRLMEMMSWEEDDCVYYGDALFPGGNDSSVIGVINTIEVRDETDTLQKLKGLT